MILLFSVVLGLSACSPQRNIGSSNVELTGTVQESGMTTYQYGTHTLQTSDRKFALKSDSLDLNIFVGQKVTVKGTKVEGYPVENGPELINVINVKR